jgi:tetratricopeptide (TPR) repeat protein
MIGSSRYRPLVLAALLAAVLLVDGCGTGGGESVKPSKGPVSKEQLYREGNLLYLQSQFDTAAAVLKRAYAMDSSYLDPALALASLYFDLGKAEAAGSKRANEHFRQSLRYYRLVEEGGNRDATVLDRLCEVSLLVGDDRAFARYAKRNADLYPFERQLYNLGLAYYGVEDYQSVVKIQKEAIEKFRTSAYLGGYYRLMGLAYVKQGRDQTAERTFVAGVKAVDARLTELRQSQRPAAEDVARLSEDRMGMLLQLKRLFQIYKKQGELDQVERQLKDATK